MTEIACIYAVSYQIILLGFNRYEKRGVENLHTAKGRGCPSIFRLDNKQEESKILK